MSDVGLVIFTCTGREHLLQKTYDSFLAACNYKFGQVILAIDGEVNPAVITYINPDLVIYGYTRKGYVTSIKNAFANIYTPYFFWLEDDWKFDIKIEVPYFIEKLDSHPDWAQIIYSKNGPLTDDLKTKAAGDHLFENAYGFSANPCFNRSSILKDGFAALEQAEKGDTLGENGFENFLTTYFLQKGIKCIIQDPVNRQPISHEGYLESTPRNWHMTNSLEAKTEKHLLTIATPTVARRLLMLLKLSKAFFTLAFKQLWNNEFYELCFRVVTSVIVTKKNG
jgi:hypothetical protein